MNLVVRTLDNEGNPQFQHLPPEQGGWRAWHTKHPNVEAIFTEDPSVTVVQIYYGDGSSHQFKEAK